MINERVKGFKDYTRKDAIKRAEIKKLLVEIFEKYGFEPAETPIIEYEEFVKGENQQDEAVSDIFKLKDKGNRKLALRYEFTFQLKRLIKNRKLPYKRYQIGPVFRDEPTSSNRFRQITQCDVDIVGSTIKDDAEILALASDALKALGIKNTILVGNRGLLNEILDRLKIEQKSRNQVLREIDKLDKLPKTNVRKNLKKFGAEKLISILEKSESYFKNFRSYKDIEELKRYCRYYGVSFKFSPSLVRGLSYYNRNVFEIKGVGMRETICAGGSYAIEGTQCTGISFGLDRLAVLARKDFEKEKFLIISLNQDERAISLAKRLREKGKNVSIYYGKPSKALEYANAYGFSKAIFVGEREIALGKFKIRDLKNGKEKFVSEEDL